MDEKPTLKMKRLIIRPFEMEDLPGVHRLFDMELSADDLRTGKMESMGERADWLGWTMLNYVQLAKLN